MKQFYKSLSVDATIMVSNKFLMIGEYVLAILLTSLVNIATVWLAKTPLILALSAYNSKTSSMTPILYY